jgi:hypothetical protein
MSAALLVSRAGVDEGSLAETLGLAGARPEFLLAGLLAEDLAAAGDPFELVAVVRRDGPLRRQAVVLPDATVLVTVAPVDELRRLADLLASDTPQIPYRAAYALHAVYGGRSPDSAVVELARTISCQWLPLHRMCGSVLRLRRLSRVRPGLAVSARCRGARLRALAHAVLAVRGHCNPHPDAAHPLLRLVFPQPDGSVGRLWPALRELAAGDPVLRGFGALRDEDLAEPVVGSPSMPKDMPAELGNNGLARLR